MEIGEKGIIYFDNNTHSGVTYKGIDKNNNNVFIRNYINKRFVGNPKTMGN